MTARAWRILAGVMDPEMPMLSVLDLGMVRSVLRVGEGVRVNLSPTYSGCAAARVIRRDVECALRAAGYEPVEVVETLSPPWSSDWITARGRRRLSDHGIAPPPRHGADPVACPRCASVRTEMIAEFGSTPCKALYRCSDCREPFDRFKCL